MKQRAAMRLTERDKQCLLRAKEFVCNDLSKRYSQQEISIHAGINRYKLTYGFKQVYGDTIHHFIEQARMKNAIQLLMETDKPLKEIAQLNGYRRVENFITAFKKYYGTTPNKMRVKK